MNINFCVPRNRQFMDNLRNLYHLYPLLARMYREYKWE